MRLVLASRKMDIPSWAQNSASFFRSPVPPRLLSELTCVWMPAVSVPCGSVLWPACPGL